MKLFFASLLIFSLFAINGKDKFAHTNKQQPGLTDIDTMVIGDINSDKIIDTAFITGPKWLNEDEGWGPEQESPYEIDITFSCGLPSIHNGTAVMGYVENIGDINEDGVSEIIVVPIWFIGCWGRMQFYTYKNGEWHNFGEAESHICNEDGYRYIERIKKLSKNKIRVIEDAWDEDVADRVKKPKILRLNSK